MTLRYMHDVVVYIRLQRYRKVVGHCQPSTPIEGRSTFEIRLEISQRASGIEHPRRKLTTHTHSLDERAHARLVASNVVLFQVVARLDPNPTPYPLH